MNGTRLTDDIRVSVRSTEGGVIREAAKGYLPLLGFLE